MYNTVECPYCGFENDMTDGLIDLPRDNKFDHECSNCDLEFEVTVEFEPSYFSSKIDYADCELCNRKQRDCKRRGCTFPYPKSEYNTLCVACFSYLLLKEYNEKAKVNSDENL